MAIEDARFWQHNGIDLRSIARAAWGILSGDYSGGASTITQQLIKNNVLGGGSEDNWGDRIERKIQEQYLALQLDKSMSKELIITNYLNTINLGNNTLGVKVAAKRYFNKDVSDLTLSECTVLAGITQNPSSTTPSPAGSQRGETADHSSEHGGSGVYFPGGAGGGPGDNVYDRIQDVDLLTRENSTPYSYFTDELIDQVMDALMDRLGYTESQATNLIYSGGLQISPPRIRSSRPSWMRRSTTRTTTPPPSIRWSTGCPSPTRTAPQSTTRSTT